MTLPEVPLQVSIVLSVRSDHNENQGKWIKKNTFLNMFEHCIHTYVTYLVNKREALLMGSCIGLIKKVLS